MLIQIVVQSSKIDDYALEEWITKQCSSPILNYSFKEVYDSISTLQVLSLIAMVLSIICMLSDIASIIICFKIIKVFKTKEERGISNHEPLLEGGQTEGQRLEEELLRRN
mmetsp:Transcript_7249/g.5507  ORF Transcript_7249/g.5507 Transcript_7249/m.5507 type:complete len:110 (+) Transcript_7249:1199-1528(+)